jgi:integrase
LPTHLLLPKLEYEVRFHHFTVQEILSLITAAQKLNPVNPVSGATYSTLIGLFWCTGMRRSEALKLNHSDVDFKMKTIMIRNSKFRKSRLIPIDETLAHKLSAYAKLKENLNYPIGEADSFFISSKGNRLSGSTLNHTFSELVRAAKIPNDSQGRQARLHDLRHSFATNTLKRFYKNPKDLSHQNYLPVLATYLGHADLKYSQYYLHPDFELLTHAGEILEKQFKKVMSL